MAAVTLAGSATVAATSPTHGLPPDPSGVPMPVGSPPGWKRVFADDFRGSKLSSHWYAYRGKTGGGGGWWDPSHVVVHGGQLVLRTYSDRARCTDRVACSRFNYEVSGGLQTKFAQTYGKYLVRVRTKPVLDVAFVALLWPVGTWPPEIDFAEEGGTYHVSNVGATLIWGAPRSAQTLQRNLTVNEARWHTLGIEWGPRRVVYTIDGRAWSTVRSPNVSSQPMVVTLQAQTDCQAVAQHACSVPLRPHEPDVEIDWIVAYAPAS